MAKKKSTPEKVSSISAQAQYEEKLEEWGFTKEEAKKLGIELIVGERNLGWVPKDAVGHVIGAIKIPYFNPDGTPMKKAVGAEDYCRFRYLFRGGSFVDLEKTCKYSQAPGTTPRPFFSKACKWEEVEAERKPLIITEGEMKANKACQLDFPTIALGGVDSFSMLNERHVSFLPELESVDWLARHVYVCYDSDIMEKEQVARAMVRLSQCLVDRGAVVYAVYLPPLPPLEDNGEERKCGLDDFLIHFGPEEFEVLLHEAQPFASAEKLLKMNNDWCLVTETKNMIDLKSLHPVKIDGFTPQMFANIEYHTVEFVNGKPRIKSENVYKAWISWRMRNQVTSITYRPGGGRYVEDEYGRRQINTWAGWGLQPKTGLVKPFTSLIDFLTSDCTAEERQWLWRWLAYPIQNPGAKLASAVTFYSNAQGTGKTLVGEIMGRIYGRNFTKINQQQLHSPFTGWIDSKQLVLGDEITGNDSVRDRKRTADQLKDLITGKTIMVEHKYQVPWEIPNCTNFIFTTNHSNAFFMETHDRRYFVVRAPDIPESTKFYDEVAAWRDSGGAAHLMQYLLSMDLGDFNPFTQPPVTSAKVEMTDMNRSEFGQWLHDVINGAPVMVRFSNVSKPVELQCDLFTPEELKRIYDPHGEAGLNIRAVQLELGAQCRKVMNGNPIRLSDGSQKRLWVVRNKDKWLKNPSLKSVISHYEKHRLKP